MEIELNDIPYIINVIIAELTSIILLANGIDKVYIAITAVLILSSIPFSIWGGLKVYNMFNKVVKYVL